MTDKKSDKICHDIHCLSNDIKDLTPKLISRIEYNKTITQSNLNFSNGMLEKEKKKTSTFLKELKLFVNIP